MGNIKNTTIHLTRTFEQEIITWYLIMFPAYECNYVGNGTMHSVQEHVNTLVIDCSIQRLTEYIYEYERNSFLTQSVTITLKNNINWPRQKKIEECAAQIRVRTANTNNTVIGIHALSLIFQRFSRAGPRGRGREWATLGVHPLSWLLSNNRLEDVCVTLTQGTFSSRLLLSNQDKGCTPSVAHSLPLPLPPGFC